MQRRDGATAVEIDRAVEQIEQRGQQIDRPAIDLDAELDAEPIRPVLVAGPWARRYSGASAATTCHG